ncbi:MAG TPA: YlaN family protein [Pseudogracilibacillus sp.]|nr:YlaN family protein [Pseudogracilibacillus sp.]
MPHIDTDYRKQALALLQKDAEQILRLIEVQIDNFTAPQCPLYEEVLDTQMFGLSREIDFAVRLQLVTEEEGKQLLDNLEQKLTILHEKAQKTRDRAIKFK